MAESITISERTKRMYEKEGVHLISEGLTTGFQIEDFNPKLSKRTLIYGHENRQHLDELQHKLGGKEYPRESVFKWSPDWGKNENPLPFNRNYKQVPERYLQTERVGSSARYIEQKMVKPKDNASDPRWIVPDTRIYGGSQEKHFKKGFLVTKNIDYNTRFSSLQPKKPIAEKIRREIHGKVTPVLIQDFRPKKKHSFFDYLSNL